MMRTRVVQVAWIALAITVSTLLSGCWSRREITETAFAGILAVDWVEGQYRLTTNILLPMAGGPGQGAAGGTKAGPQNKPAWTIQAGGQALDEAVGRLERLSPRRLYLAHVRSVLVGEAMARRGLHPILDFLSRSVEIRPTAWIGVVPGLAGPLLTARPMMESYPGNGPLGYHDLVPRQGSLAPARRLTRVVRILTEEGNDLALPAFRLAQPGGDPTVLMAQATSEVVVGGAGIFRDDRLVAWLEPETTRGLLWGTGGIELGPVVVPCPRGTGRAVFRLHKSTVKRQVVPDAKGVKATLRITVIASANSVLCNLGPGNRPELAQLEAALAREVKREVQAALAVAHGAGSDAFGFGQILFRRDPARYRSLLPNWRRMLADLPVTVEVRARVPRTAQKYDVILFDPEAEQEAGGGP